MLVRTVAMMSVHGHKKLVLKIIFVLQDVSCHNFSTAFTEVLVQVKFG